MKVTLCVDALAPRPGGIGRYTWELCKGLSRNPAISELQFVRHGRLIGDPSILLGDSMHSHPRRRFAKLRRWLEGRKLGSGLVHGPNYFLPQFAEGGVVTVHDLSVLLYPETHPLDRIRAFEKQFTSSLARATHIITDTETVRDEVMQHLSVPGERVSAVHLGVDDRFRPRPAQGLAPQLKALGLTAGRYGLCISTLEPRKKIGDLLSAWRHLQRPLRDQYPLVLAGGSGWRNEALLDQIAVGQAEGWLIHLGFVDDEQLPALYAGAALFLYPSIYEGFGLPPLEAMASGVPVVVSNRSCMPEVCGAAARYIDPDDEEGFTAAIEQALVDEHWRAEAVRSGLERAAGLTWDRCMEGTVAAYRKSLSAKA